VDSFQEFLSSYSPQVQELALHICALIHRVLPNALEIVDKPSKIIAYGYSPKYSDLICAIAPYKTHVNLIFSKGTQLPDPDRLLTGTGKHARHVKIESQSDILNPALETIIKWAGAEK
jgi:hypothetical protein